MNQSCAVRAQTTVAPQALALFNGEFARESVAAFAARLRCEAGDDAAQQISPAFELALTRPPSTAESTEAIAFLRDQTAKRHAAAAAALADLCHALLNANELLYPD